MGIFPLRHLMPRKYMSHYTCLIRYIIPNYGNNKTPDRSSYNCHITGIETFGYTGDEAVSGLLCSYAIT